MTPLDDTALVGRMDDRRMVTVNRIAFLSSTLAITIVVLAAANAIHAEAGVVDIVAPPDNVISADGDVIAVHASGPDGTTLKDARIDLGSLGLKGLDPGALVLVEHVDGALTREIEFRRDRDSIIADLTNGRDYLILATSSGRLARDYALLCALDRSRDQIPRHVIDPICRVILCANEVRTAGSLLSQFPELGALRPELAVLAGGEPIDTLEIGGWGPPFGSGGVCERCTRFGRPGLIAPSRACLKGTLGKEIPEKEPKFLVEIEINETATGDDDYLTWAPRFARARLVTLPGSSRSDRQIVLTNDSPSAFPDGGDVVFAPIQEPWPPNATAIHDQLDLLLPGDGSWTRFVVAGKFGRASSANKDALILARRDTATGTQAGSKAMMVRVRKDANKLTAGERDRFLRAMRGLRNAGVSGYLMFQELHRLASTAGDEGHMQPAFYPWHRAMLLQVERELQKLDPSVALPYWNWDAAAPNVFSQDFMGAPGTGSGFLAEPIFSAANPLNGWNTDLPFNSGELLRNTDDHTRLPAPTDFIPLDRPPGVSLVNYPDFGLRSTASFSRRGEEESHNPAHGWPCGSGQLANTNRSAADPLFYLLHTQVDRQWAYWQRRHGRIGSGTGGSLAFAAPADYDNIGHWNDPGVTAWQQGSFLEDGMWPWDGSSGGSSGDRAERPVNQATGPGTNVPTSQSPVSSSPFPPSSTPNLWPASASAAPVRDMIDYLGKFRPQDGLGFSYDDVPYQ